MLKRSLLHEQKGDLESLKFECESVLSAYKYAIAVRTFLHSLIKLS